MNELDEIIRSATAAIGPQYFQLPVAGRDPALYERVYCYELYHQMRSRWPETNLLLTGEIPKRGHEIIMASIGSAVVPDFLIHEPGNMGNNCAIMEVKSSQANTFGIRKDLATLDQFCVQVGYQRAFYLFYGGEIDLDLIRQLAAHRPVQAYIEIWMHSEPGLEAQIIGTLP
ncbi:methionyl-tRNA formyltransferase-like protein [Rhizobium leguminosarum]|uniref:methionyl-tRNA formyltransferase-like protein n=1 Tax=Rhizobium leguminosarum TaxID=384 RepID=UPI0014413507|nr:methionyl-tRNA formyltransferase-like protein [Rhizobium leguminosarum]MBY3026658.1 methionyl-tRNA formyltransferase-like protein [Rhizobium leguminosarum]NKL74099.1 methionyl-tRNA formyltransferase-like protein [Rhizobium leguminosarum bv. viciae]